MNGSRRQQIVTELSRLEQHELDALLGEVSDARGAEAAFVGHVGKLLARKRSPILDMFAGRREGPR